MSQMFQVKLVDADGKVVHEQVLDYADENGVMVFNGKHYMYFAFRDRVIIFRETKCLELKPQAKRLTEQEVYDAVKSLLTPTRSWKPSLPLGDGESALIKEVAGDPGYHGKAVMSVTLDSGQVITLQLFV